MKRLLLVLLLSVSAFAQTTTIQSLVPNTGPSTGGTLVLINGTNLNPAAVCLLPCPPRVSFGGVTVDATDLSSTQLSVITPPHDAGTVDVVVAVTGRQPVVVNDAFTFTSSPEDAYEKVLLPIYFKGVISGAHDAQWKSDFWMYNGGDTNVQIAPAICPPTAICPPVFPLTYNLQAGHAVRNPDNFFAPQETNLSQILYLSRNAAKNVSMSLRIADISRSTLNAGTDLPVIREGEFLTGNARLLDVPFFTFDFRVLLRIYDVSNSDALYTVNLYPADEGAVQPTYTMTLRAVTSRMPPFRDEAAYVEFDLGTLLMLRRTWPDRVHIEIKPETGGSQYWAVVSVTNNATHQTTLVTPQ